MVIIPVSSAVAEGLTFTVGQITWTTHASGLKTTTLKENQLRPKIVEVVAPITPTTTITTPTTRPMLPRYKGKQVDNSDLLEAIDHANHRLLEVSDLVDSISHQTARAPHQNFPTPVDQLVPPRTNGWGVLDGNSNSQRTNCQIQDNLSKRESTSRSE